VSFPVHPASLSGSPGVVLRHLVSPVAISGPPLFFLVFSCFRSGLLLYVTGSAFLHPCLSSTCLLRIATLSFFLPPRVLSGESDFSLGSSSLCLDSSLPRCLSFTILPFFSFHLPFAGRLFIFRAPGDVAAFSVSVSLHFFLDTASFLFSSTSQSAALIRSIIARGASFLLYASFPSPDILFSSLWISFFDLLRSSFPAEQFSLCA